MATSKARMKKIADQIEEAAGKASVKVEDEASRLARELRETGRDIDDKLDEWADENANDLSRWTGMDKDDSSMAIKVVVWLLAIGFVGLLIKGLAGFFG